MQRLRAISRFECDVRVLRNSFCKNSPLYPMFQDLKLYRALRTIE